ncbi:MULTISPECIES: flagella basal body P-ring formation protein FlgA [Symbiopectobacterium]|uniref:flagella basal body P-ring formation protein FlgA n=1 Tax=Candidatus Symbiopectobacterium sp. PLON1 TaxID=2794575 RepID=UPI002079C80E|nr:MULTISPECIES: flagella basal body P-ring formation protein FlgA [Symbiopectobacterium]
MFALLTSLIGNVHVAVAADLQAQLDQFFHARFPDKHSSVIVMIKSPPEQWSQCEAPVLAQGVGFSINSGGKAMGNAAVGQSVRVRMASGQIVSGIAGEDGVILIAQ